MPGAQRRRRTEIPGGRGSPDRWSILLLFTVLLATMVVYLPATSFGFVTWDDGPYVFENPVVLSGLSRETLAWAFTAHTPYWHPVTWSSHLLDVTLFGPDPRAMHAVNVAIHLANTLLLLILLRRLTSRSMPSVVVAALFALHPLHVESVAWIAERKDLLSTFFLWLALIGYQHYVRRPSVLRYMGVTLAFCLSLMSKPMFVTLPVLLLLLDYWPLGRVGSASSLAKLSLEKWPLAVLSGASAVATYVAQQRTGTMAVFDALPAGARAAHAIVSYVAYLRKTIWPADLAAFYPYPHVPPSTLTVAAAALLLVSLTVLAIGLRHRMPYLLFGWLWYLISLVPVIGLIQVGNQAMADRFTYVPLVGIFIAAVWAADGALGERRGRVMGGAAAAAALLACTVVTRAQVLTWSNATTMWSRVLEITPDSYYAHSALGAELADHGSLDAARRHQEEALRLHPSDPDAHNELGKLAAERGELEAAIGYFSAAVRLNRKFGEAHHNLGTALLRSGRTAEAIEPLRQASDLLPHNAASRRGLGEALASTGKWADATEAFRSALRLDPNSAVTHFQIGLALDQQTKLGEAIVHYEAAVAIDTRFAEWYGALGIAYARTGDLERAEKTLRTAVSLQPLHPAHRFNLALILARTGRHDDAIELVQAGLATTPDDEALRNLLTRLRSPR